MATTNITMRVDEELKKQAEELFADLGMNMTTAIVTFLRQSVREQRIPFMISKNIPNEQTLQAFLEVQQLKNDPNKKVYDNFAELLKEMEDEI